MSDTTNMPMGTEPEKKPETEVEGTPSTETVTETEAAPAAPSEGATQA